MKILKLIILTSVLLSFSCKERKDNIQIEHVQQDNGKHIKVAATDFKEAVENKKVQLIDVRRPDEYADGHLKNAANINFYDDDFITKISKLDKSQPIYLYCRSGGRSGKAATMLSKKGFKVYDLKGGILYWKANNYLVKTN